MKKKNIVVKNETLFTEGKFGLIAGPCAIENEADLRQTAELLQKLGLKMLRGGVTKLRTSPHSFQGMGKPAFQLLSNVAKDYGLYSVTEITSTDEIDEINKHIDIVWIGTRNMYNYQLLKEVGKLDKPIILKRAISATIKEWLLAAEYIKLSGNTNIILCERGIRTFDHTMRYTLDLATAVYVSQTTEHHVIIDPSHATGKRELVTPMTLAGKAAGVSGAMIEIHPMPSQSQSDSEQMLGFEEFTELVENANFPFYHENNFPS
jgi:3-deoxy-7-phosphoheptulonate synthase